MLLKQLSEAFGVSGAEDEVRNIIRDKLLEFDKIRTDSMGNLFVEKESMFTNPKIMLCAHMDEVGIMIKAIDKNGMLKFNTVGGIDERVLVSKTVVIGSKRVRGVIGAKAIHLQEPKDRKIPIKLKKLYIDIGAKDKDEAEKQVEIGEYATFDTKYDYIGDDIVTGKAFDDRIGCYVILDLLKRQYNIPVVGVFTVQEEVGLRGAATAAYSVNPDISIVLETTFASDVPETKEDYYCTTLGKGPAITFMDKTYIADKKLIKRVVYIAESNNIPYQYKMTVSGGTDGGRIHTTKEGVPTIILSVPCRYIHSPVSMANRNDIENTIKLAHAIILDLQERGLD
ncbi:MAG: M42 family metallopeptidase [Thermoanaerobacterales bacterium]|nr:M42 family metallopeptidase [Thermoanaerobacterales bacterium]